MGISAGPNSISDGLVFHIDPANPRSYAGVGTVIYDISGNNNTSFFTNGAFYQNYSKGIVNVDGNDDFISTPLFTLTSPITVSAWVKNVINEGIVFGSSAGYGNAEYIFYFVGKTLHVQGSPGGAKVFQFPQLNLNQWSNLVMTRDIGNNMSVYFNGIGSTSNTQSYSNTLLMNQIGRYSSFSNQYNVKGSIGEVKIYNRALSQSEVLQNYNASIKRYLPEENIVTNGLIFNLDAANPSSYAGTGNTSYNLIGGISATLLNGTGFSSVAGGCWLFDGTDDGINTTINIDNDPITINAWVYCTEVTSVNGRGIVLSDNGGWDRGLEINSSMWGVHDGSNLYKVGTVLNNTWYHTSLSYSSNIWTLYVNGSFVFSRGSSTSSGSLATIGRADYNFGTRIFQGLISQVLIYNRPLSATEIQQNFNAMRERYNL
jgi:hypothetical protein